jgi:hypothetical protein
MYQVAHEGSVINKLIKNMHLEQHCSSTTLRNEGKKDDNAEGSSISDGNRAIIKSLCS